MKWCIETATGARRGVADDYEAQPGEMVKDMVEDAPAKGISAEEDPAPAPAPEEEAPEEEEEEEDAAEEAAEEKEDE